MALDGVAGEVLYPSQGLFYFKVADPFLMSAIFRAYNDWLAEFCRTDPARLKGIAMINLDDVEDGAGIRGFDAGAQILDHLIGLQHVGPDLVAPADVGLFTYEGARFGTLLLKLNLIET